MAATPHTVTTDPSAPAGPSRKTRVFWSAFASILVLDIITKLLAQRHLIEYEPVDVIGTLGRLRLVYNPGAAFGISLGDASRWFFSIVAIVVLVVLARIYRETDRADWIRSLALGMVCAGAIGNLFDRIRSQRGVTDFIDLGIDEWRWYTFNVADIGVSIGAILLAWSLWQEEKAMKRRSAAEGSRVT
ncbi:MAG: signal peptidase II [Gemmatimonadota bacterium]|nr:signal peptidase II [Gemmatimonadota bacterium]